MYIIIPFNSDPFITDFYTYENCFDHTKIRMILKKNDHIGFSVSYDGINFKPIEIDNL